MERKTQNQFNNNNPVVIILVVALLGLGVYIIFSQNQNNTQPTQGNQNYQRVTDNSQNTQLSAPEKQSVQENATKTKSTSDMVQEWRKSAVDIECAWGAPILGNYMTVSGSGLLVILNSQPTIITNRHVVNYPTTESFDGCSFKFPDDSWLYSIDSLYEKALGRDSLQYISYNPNNYDVAYLTFPPDQTEHMNVDIQNGFYSLTPNQRARSDNYLCKNPLAIGDPIVILGFPAYGGSNQIFNSNRTGGNPVPVEVTATEGIISGKDGIYYTTSAKIDSGNSGGLAIDAQNDCYFGIPTWNESGNFESLGRILPASTFLHY